ncbi:MAG: DNA primase [Paracoccaceae bacterium]|jgi:DNA primase
MSLPVGFLDDLRNRVSLSSVVARKVVWDQRKSNLSKGDMWAPCPFHQEKSASFHVDDRKGFYYCFGCHAKGDALSFLRETENIGFMEAVELLAHEVGLTMPARDSMAAQKDQARKSLADVMEEAVKFYRLQLATHSGQVARTYLAERGLGPDALSRWDIGLGPDKRQALFSALTAKGLSADLIVEAGLCALPDGGGAPFDRFRGRIIFPIRDARGRCIGLGGRSLDPNARAKYLNSPETPLFDKGRSLYNIGHAREAAGKGYPLVVAEGYMDVIALSEAGFKSTVAPLGTAITAEQLRLMWRIHPEPIIALDGDSAGVRAALRVVDLALPLIEAGQGLRFSILPQGLDPDDLIKQQGPGAMQQILDQAQPMIKLLWQRETEGRVFDSPERKAALDKTLRAALKNIKDPSIREYYGSEIKELQYVLFGQVGHRPLFRKGQTSAFSAPPMAATRASLLANATDSRPEELLRLSLILAVAATYPQLISEFETALENLFLPDPSHNLLLRAILAQAHVADLVEARNNIRAIAGDDLDALFALTHIRIAPPLRPGAAVNVARQSMAEELAKYETRCRANREISDAAEDLSGFADEGLTWRIIQANSARLKANRANLEDVQDLGEDRAALSKQLQNMIDREIWKKNSR